MTKAKAKQETDGAGYPLAPINISKAVWLYAEAKGVTVVIEECDFNGKHVRTLQANVPWSNLCELTDLHRKNTAGVKPHSVRS